MTDVTSSYEFLILLRPEPEATGLMRLLEDVRVADSVPATFAAPGRRGLDFFTDSAAQPYPAGRVVYVLDHEEGLAQAVGDRLGLYYVGLRNAAMAAQYVHSPKFRSFLANGPLDFAAMLMSDFSASGVRHARIFDEGEAERMAQLASDWQTDPVNLHEPEAVEAAARSASLEFETEAAPAAFSVENLPKNFEDLLQDPTLQLESEQVLAKAMCSGSAALVLTKSRLIWLRTSRLRRLFRLSKVDDFLGIRAVAHRVNVLGAYLDLLVTRYRDELGASRREVVTIAFGSSPRWGHERRVTAGLSCRSFASVIRQVFLMEADTDQTEVPETVLSGFRDHLSDALKIQREADESLDRKAATFAATFPFLIGLAINNIQRLGSARLQALAYVIFFGGCLVCLSGLGMAALVLRARFPFRVWLGTTASRLRVTKETEIADLVDYCRVLETAAGQNELRFRRKATLVGWEFAVLILGAVLLLASFFVAIAWPK